MEKSRIIRFIIMIFSALAFTLSAVSLMLNTDFSARRLIPGFLGLALVGAVLAYFLFRNIIWPNLEASSLKVRLAWIVPCLLAGFVLVYTIPVTAYPKINRVTIISTGEKNEQAKGSEVWLTGIGTGRRAFSVNGADICRGDWQPREGALVSFENQPSQLVCMVKADDRVYFRFGMHPWSGKVRLVFNGQSVDYDLYSLEGGAQEVDFPVLLGTTASSIRYLLLVAYAIAMSVVLLAAGLWFAYRPIQPSNKSLRSPGGWYVYALPIAIIWFIYLLAFWPGFLSPDTLTQFSEISSRAIKDWHPAFHTMSLWLITRLWFSPTPIIVVQIITLSALLGWGLSLIQSNGTPSGLTWLAAAYLALSPTSGLMLLNPWKDIAYTIAIVALTLLTFQIVLSDGQWVAKTASWISLGIVAALVSLYRHNGFPTAFATLAFLLLAYRSQWRPLLAATVLSLALWVGVRGPLYKIVGVDTNEATYGKNLGVEATSYSLIYKHIQSGTVFSPEERELLEKLFPQDGRSLATLAENSNLIDRLALQLTLRNPLTTLDFLLRKFTFIFQVLQPIRDRIGYVEMRIYENPFGLQSDSRLPQAQTLLKALAAMTETPEWDWLFWRNAFWMYLFILATAVACIRLKSYKYILMVLPVLVNALPLSVFSGGQIARYILPTIFLGALFSGYLLLIQPTEEPQSLRDTEN